jgi:anti-anti-sigma factor
MEIKARQKGRVIILDLSGRLDADAAELVEIVGQCVRDGYTDICCDFDGVSFIDYIGISALVLAYKEVINHKGRLKIAGVPAHLKGIFGVTGLDHVLDIHPTLEEALASFSQDAIIEKIQKMQLRRRFKRLPIDMKIKLRSRAGREIVCATGEILNLSGVGAFISGCRAFKLNDPLTLTLTLPPKNEILELEARVVWAPDKQTQVHFYPGIGVEFHPIDTHKQQRLLEFIERNLSRMASEK